jgi:hypothetical protein
MRAGAHAAQGTRRDSGRHLAVVAEGAAGPALAKSWAGPLPEAAWPRWDVFAAAAPAGSLFQTAWWYQAWGIRPEIIALTDAAGEISAGMAVMVGRQLGFSAIRRPTMTPINAPLVRLAEASQGRRGQSEIRQQLQRLLAALPRVAMVDIACHDGLLEPAQFHWSGFDSMLGLTYVIPAGTADWRAGLGAGRRSQLRKAEREFAACGCRLDLDPPIAEVGTLLAGTAELKNYRRSARRWLDRLAPWWEAVAEHDAGRLYGVRAADGTLLCATVLVWDGRRAYYLGGGIRPALRRASHLNGLLFARMIDDALGHGLDFDFEGSVLPGVERYFRDWGGEPRPTYRFVKLASPAAFALWQAYRFFSVHRRPLAGGTSD